MFSLIKLFFIIISLGVASMALSQAAEKPTPVDAAAPHQVVEQVTDRLMTLVKSEQETIKNNPQQYYTAVHSILDEVVNFQFIARGVMGSYWKQATPEQQMRFVETFKNGMIETYAKGMANFANLKMEVEPPAKDKSPNPDRATVVQKITSADKVTRVAYALKREGDGWRLVNVIIDGVNLGMTLKSQFAQAMKENKGDLDTTINSWSS